MKSRIVLTGLVSLLACAPSSASAQDFVAPSWIAAPDPEFAGELLPSFAGLIGVAGRATIKCLAIEDGHAFRCEVVEESPAGLGFGSAGRLVVASGTVAAARMDGRPVARWVQTRVRFHSFDLDAPMEPWTGREPSAEGLALAREVVETMPIYAIPKIDDLMGGLDHDRRAVVRTWIDELLPGYEAVMREAPIIQTARLFTEDQLRDILAGRHVALPHEDEIAQACPEPSPAELTALRELRRRYCERFGCDIDG